MAAETASTIEDAIARLKQDGSYDPADFTGTDLSTTDSINRLTKWLGKKKPAVVILDNCSISDKGAVILGRYSILAMCVGLIADSALLLQCVRS